LEKRFSRSADEHDEFMAVCASPYRPNQPNVVVVRSRWAVGVLVKSTESNTH
jgi:hypothetical protein